MRYRVSIIPYSCRKNKKDFTLSKNCLFFVLWTNLSIHRSLSYTRPYTFLIYSKLSQISVHLSLCAKLYEKKPKKNLSFRDSNSNQYQHQYHDRYTVLKIVTTSNVSQVEIHLNNMYLGP